MLKKLLYNKFSILRIPGRLPFNSEEIIKILIERPNCCMFEYEEDLRLLAYTGFEPDFAGRATKYQPLYVAGGETYGIKSKDEVVVYNENPFSSGLSASYFGYEGYIKDDINNYINMLNIIDNAIIVNTKHVLLPFIAKAPKTTHAEKLKTLLKKILGEDFENMVVQINASDKFDGTMIETTNVQLFVQTLQDTKKKILDEAFLYLGVGAPAGKLAHESELEAEQNQKVVDLLGDVMFKKINDFLTRCNEKFGCEMVLVKNY